MAQVLAKLPDEELARRARAGSAACYEEIVRRYQAPLMRFLTRRFPSRRDAEDILQDTFVKAWQSLHMYDAAYAFRTWFYTIAYRLAVSRGRRERWRCRRQRYRGGWTRNREGYGVVVRRERFQPTCSAAIRTGLPLVTSFSRR